MKIAILGKMCSGKTTIANYIINLYPNYKKFSFGSGVKEVAKTYFNMSSDPSKKDRSLLISVGMKMRDIDPDVWINHTMNQIRDQNAKHCIIDDVRFQNELDRLIDDDWLLIKLNVSKETQEERIKKIYPDTYSDHINNMNNISEQQDFIFNKKPELCIDSDNSKEHIIEQIQKFFKFK